VELENDIASTTVTMPVPTAAVMSSLGVFAASGSKKSRAASTASLYASRHRLSSVAAAAAAAAADDAAADDDDGARRRLARYTFDGVYKLELRLTASEDAAVAGPSLPPYVLFYGALFADIVCLPLTHRNPPPTLTPQRVCRAHGVPRTTGRRGARDGAGRH